MEILSIYIFQLVLSAAVAATVLSVSGVAVFAIESDTFRYLAGQQRGASYHK